AGDVELDVDVAGDVRQAGVDAAAVAVAAVVGHHGGVADPGPPPGLGDGVVQVADLVHQPELPGVQPGVDPAVGQHAHALLRQPAAGGHHAHELVEEAVDHPLQDGPLLVGHRPERVADVLDPARLDRAAGHADLGEQPGGVVQAHDHADAT